jgi:hypothetical protein
MVVNQHRQQQQLNDADFIFLVKMEMLKLYKL